MLLRSLSRNVKEQNWFAVGIDFVIVVIGVFMGLQATSWNEARLAQSRAETYYERLEGDLLAELVSLRAHELPIQQMIDLLKMQ